MPSKEQATSSMSYRELRARGLSRTDITLAIRAGTLIRARRDVYVSALASRSAVAAARVGGRLDSVSLMHELGVFVLDRGSGLHVQVPTHRSHLRSPNSRTIRLDGHAHQVVVHWRDDDVPENALYAGIVPALAQAIVDQQPRAGIATIDSALHVGLIAQHELERVFDQVPLRLHRLRGLVDGRAESGPETLARLIARSFGVPVKVQVSVEDVGRADLIVDGWIVVECDSREFHGGWEQQQRDRIRDLGYAAHGCTTIRPTAHQLFTRPELFRDALAGLLARGPA